VKNLGFFSFAHPISFICSEGGLGREEKERKEGKGIDRNRTRAGMVRYLHRVPGGYGRTVPWRT